MALFSGLDTPKWMTPEDRSLAATQGAGPSGQLFAQALGQKRQQNFLSSERDKEIKLVEEKQKLAIAKFAPVAEKLKSADSPTAAWQVVSENPEWLADPQIAPALGNYLKAQTEVAQAEAASLDSKMKIQGMTEFGNRLNNLSPELQSKVRMVPSGPKGVISPDQWEELARGEEVQKSKAIAGLPVSQVTVGKGGEVSSVYKTDETSGAQSPLGKLLRDREAAVKSGNSRDIAFYDAEIAARGKKDGFTIQFDDQGRPIINYGPQGGSIGSPTVATQSASQRKLLKYEAATQLMNTLEQTISEEHIGARGVLGEVVLDRGLSQFIPELANKDRIDFRTGLVAARESLLREISDDTRFSNVDREEIAKALPSSGVFESMADAKQRIATVRKIVSQRGKVYSQSLGITPPLWTLSKDEIKALYDAKKISEEQAVDAISRFH